MKIVDLNVVIYAINRDSPQHRIVHAWWEKAMNSDETIAFPWVVLLGFLRLSTNARVFPRAMTPAQSAERVDAWLAHPNAAIVTEARDHWSTLRELLDAAGTAGNLTTDAHLAALAITHGAVLVSCDNDFARFEGLRWENPMTKR